MRGREGDEVGGIGATPGSVTTRCRDNIDCGTSVKRGKVFRRDGGGRHFFMNSR